VHQFTRRRHSVTALHVHLVFTIKYRRRVLTGEHIEALRQAVSHACIRLDCGLMELDGETDHIHLLVRYPPKLAIAVLVNSLKAVSSRKLRAAFSELRRVSRSTALWSRSYFACSVGGAPIDVLRRYIEQQATPA